MIGEIVEDEMNGGENIEERKGDKRLSSPLTSVLYATLTRNVAHIQEGLLVFGRRWSALCTFRLLADVPRSTAFVWPSHPGSMNRADLVQRLVCKQDQPCFLARCQRSRAVWIPEYACRLCTYTSVLIKF